jgi:MGT family glycosyltransferase
VHASVPQLAVLEHASAFVTHAGMGGSTESLWFGVPTVSIPQAVDQFANAAMLEAIGVGKHLPADQVTVETLREAVLRVAESPSVRSNLDQFRAEVRANGGVERAANAVEEFLTR